jgi:SAM-dependent methyltransferase
VATKEIPGLIEPGIFLGQRMLKFDQIIQKIDQLEEANILLAALELKVFSILNKKFLSAKAIALKAKTQPWETEQLLNALVAMGALTKKNGLFKNTSETYKHLCEKSPHFKKGFVRLRQENRDEWAGLLETLKNGRDISSHEDEDEEDDPEFRWFFTHAMHERSEIYSGKVAEAVARKPVGRLIDLGGGPGSYSAAILRKDKKASATLFDRKVTLEVAKEILSSSKVFPRFEFLEGDLFTTEYGKNYDTIFFSNILHIYNPKENKFLFKKIHRALVSGGRFILVDLFLRDNKTDPFDAALFSLTMLMFTATGKTYTFTETEALLKAAGFVSFKRFPLTESTSMIEAIKK